MGLRRCVPWRSSSSLTSTRSFAPCRAATTSPSAISTWRSRPGEFFCLLGTSGCGKTTVLNMLAGFERASVGEDRDRRPSRSTGPGADRGVVFQGDDSLYPWLSALGNVEFGMRMRGMPRAERLEAGAPLSRPRRTDRPGPQASGRAVRRHEAAHPDRARARQRAADAADGRAVRRARRAHARRHAARADQDLAGDGEDGAVHHARHR